MTLPYPKELTDYIVQLKKENPNYTIKQIAELVNQNKDLLNKLGASKVSSTYVYYTTDPAARKRIWNSYTTYQKKPKAMEKKLKYARIYNKKPEIKKKQKDRQRVLRNLDKVIFEVFDDATKLDETKLYERVSERTGFYGEGLSDRIAEVVSDLESKLGKYSPIKQQKEGDKIIYVVNKRSPYHGLCGLVAEV